MKHFWLNIIVFLVSITIFGWCCHGAGRATIESGFRIDGKLYLLGSKDIFEPENIIQPRGSEKNYLLSVRLRAKETATVSPNVTFSLPFDHLIPSPSIDTKVFVDPVTSKLYLRLSEMHVRPQDLRLHRQHVDGSKLVTLSEHRKHHHTNYTFCLCIAVFSLVFAFYFGFCAAEKLLTSLRHWYNQRHISETAAT